jgi:hypothetical protein
MEELLSVLPLIFCFWTGILIAWGAYDGYKSAAIISDVIGMGRAIRSSDVIQLVITIIVTPLLFIALFVVPQFVSLHLDTILFLEIWYSLFLFYVTEHIFYNIEPLKHLKNSNSVQINFHPKIN